MRFRLFITVATVSSMNTLKDTFRLTLIANKRICSVSRVVDHKLDLWSENFAVASYQISLAYQFPLILTMPQLDDFFVFWTSTCSRVISVLCVTISRTSRIKCWLVNFYKRKIAHMHPTKIFIKDFVPRSTKQIFSMSNFKILRLNLTSILR